MGGMRGGNPGMRGGGLGSGSTMDYGHMGGFGGFDEGFCFHSHKAASDAKRQLPEFPLFGQQKQVRNLESEQEARTTTSVLGRFSVGREAGGAWRGCYEPSQGAHGQVC